MFTLYYERITVYVLQNVSQSWKMCSGEDNFNPHYYCVCKQNRQSGFLS